MYRLTAVCRRDRRCFHTDQAHARIRQHVRRRDIHRHIPLEQQTLGGVAGNDALRHVPRKHAVKADHAATAAAMRQCHRRNVVAVRHKVKRRVQMGGVVCAQ